MSRSTSTRSKSPASSTSGFSCRHYKSAPGGKRCRHYRDSGRCVRPEAEQGRCLEWLKINAPSSTTSDEASPVARDLFGNPVQAAKPRRGTASKPAPPPAPAAPPETPAKPPLVRNITDDEVSSFKALGAEVCVRSEGVGDLWIVPEYTEVDRIELSIEHSITLTAICAAFPGAKVVELKRKI